MNDYRSRFIDLGTHVMSFYDIGLGEPVVMLHGLMGSKTLWSRSGIIYALSKYKYRLLAIDLRGHGGTGVPSQENYMKIDYLASDIEKIIKYLDINSLTLVGFSAGASVAVNLSLSIIDRINRLILIAPMIKGDKRYFSSIARRISKLYEENAIYDIFKLSIELAYSSDYLARNRRSIQTEIERIIKARKDTVKHVAEFYIDNADYDMVPKLEYILSKLDKVTILISNNDKMIDTSPLKELEHIGNLKIITLTSVGHMIPMEKPDVVIESIIGTIGKET